MAFLNVKHIRQRHATCVLEKNYTCKRKQKNIYTHLCEGKRGENSFQQRVCRTNFQGWDFHGFACLDILNSNKNILCTILVINVDQKSAFASHT